MDIIIKSKDIKEILIADVVKSADKGLLINKRQTIIPRADNTEEQKKLAAIEALRTSPIEAAKIHGMNPDTLREYTYGNHVAPETRTEILAVKHGIAELATVKLMEALNLFDPNMIEKHEDIARAASSLSKIIVDSTGKRDANQSVHLHMYMPSQKKVKDYPVIDV